MGMTLRARNRKVASINMSYSAWTLLMSSGVGLVIGFSKASKDGECIFVRDKHGRVPHTSDSFYVNAHASKAMALALNGFVTAQRCLWEEWNMLSSEEQDSRIRKYEANHRLGDNRLPASHVFEELALELAEFARQSHGFWLV